MYNLIHIMKWILLLLIVCLMSNCNNPVKKQVSDQETKIKPVSQTDTLELDSQIKSFEATYENIIKELNDSIFKYKPEDNDFSDFTGGIERKYKECNKDLTKTLIGFKLAENYYIHFESSNKKEFIQKAEPLFFLFVSYNNGEMASRYLKLDIKKVHYIVKEWNNFSEQNKKIILLYGLLRGFDNGLPDVLKNVE
jgi:hypothetical protein